MTDGTSGKKENRHPPKIIALKNPVYPLELRRQGIEASVSVDIIVRTDGSVVVDRVWNSPHLLFDAAIVAAAKEWRFTPGVVGDRPVNTKLRMPIKFEL